LQGRVELPPRKLLEQLFHKIDEVPQWNPTVVRSEKLKVSDEKKKRSDLLMSVLWQVIDEFTDITYQATAKIAAGIVSSRDFVVLRQWAEKEGQFIASARSISNGFYPEQDGIIR
jgi:StAR-related lipid transfer protein 3